MCCYNIQSAKAKLLKRFGKRKTLAFWKLVRLNGQAEMSEYRYRIGVNRSNYKGRYSIDYPKGIHVYTRKPRQSYGRVILVICHRDDLIRAEDCQAVFTKVTIRAEAWEKAGLKDG